MAKISFSPKDYVNHYHKWLESYHNRYFKPTSRNGTFKPVVHLMMWTGITMYMVKYYNMGRHRVALEREEVEEGKRLLHEKCGDHH
mmetsp:Transcript_13619/g.20246  ORF Transcript_13619/g.20246 Transcript_13619/m.20246 type:complete len:86 (-) Transcript_13619:69-326(-)